MPAGPVKAKTLDLFSLWHGLPFLRPLGAGGLRANPQMHEIGTPREASGSGIGERFCRTAAGERAALPMATSDAGNGDPGAARAFGGVLAASISEPRSASADSASSGVTAAVSKTASREMGVILWPPRPIISGGEAAIATD